jgi:hypothetical protein
MNKHRERQTDTHMHMGVHRVGRQDPSCAPTTLFVFVCVCVCVCVCVYHIRCVLDWDA